ncbi:MAG: cytochrome c-type biogenesis protein CcmH [Byssovorax sp.]
MLHRRRIARSIVLAVALVAALASLRFTTSAFAQDMGDMGKGMDRSGVLDIRNDEEKRVFSALQCTCGCPRESLVTCPCGFAHDFRIEVRAMMAKGMTLEEIKTEWVRQHGPGAMMVPTNEGANRFLYIAPLVMIMGMAAFAVTMLRRFRRGGVNASARAAAATTPSDDGAPDAYDAKLDEELKQLDDKNDE